MTRSSGDAPPKRVYVSTSDTGVVLSTFVDTGIDLQYVREAYLPSNRRTDLPDQYFTNGSYDFDSFEDRATELYPWTFENELARSLVTRTGAPFLYRTGTYSVTVDHPHGTSRGGDLITYIDGGTTDVFREVQYLSPQAIVSDEPQTNRSDGVLVQVNRTYASGPLEIRVRDAETNEPVAATVAIDGEPVGETGSDGRLWTLTPRDPFVVNATTRNTTVSVPITFPSDPFPG